jgi:hypothetical protein
LFSPIQTNPFAKNPIPVALVVVIARLASMESVVHHVPETIEERAKGKVDT